MKRSFEDFLTRLEAAGLKAAIEKRSLKAHVSLRDLYEGPLRAPSIVAARRAIYGWLQAEGKGLNEIGRLFDRSPSGVSKLLNSKEGS